MCMLRADAKTAFAKNTDLAADLVEAVTELLLALATALNTAGPLYKPSPLRTRIAKPANKVRHLLLKILKQEAPKT